MIPTVHKVCMSHRHQVFVERGNAGGGGGEESKVGKKGRKTNIEVTIQEGGRDRLKH